MLSSFFNIQHTCTHVYTHTHTHMHMHTHIHAYLSGRHAQEGVVASDDELGPPGQEKDNQHSIKVSTRDGEGDSSTT